MGENRCRRCNTVVDSPGWLCWLCDGPLCHDCGERHGHCDHQGPPLDDLDRLWATADEVKRAELLAATRELAAKYEGRTPMILRRPISGEPN